MPNIPLLLIYNKHNDHLLKIILHDENMTAEERLKNYFDLHLFNQPSNYDLNLDNYYAIVSYVDLER